jgi:uncharacterized protein YdeI (BOF family)
MKRAIAVTLAVLFFLSALTVLVLVPQKSLANDWFWQTNATVLQIQNECCNDNVVVVEGEIGDQTNPTFNEYDFSDGTGTITLDFEDEIPAAAIPQNTTVRIIGKVDDQNPIIDVYGLQTQGTVDVQPNATAAGINAGNFEDQDVIIEGQIGDRESTEPGYSWKWYDFTDSTDTTTVDLENDLSESQIPQNRTLLIFGEGDDYFGQVQKVNVDLMLISGETDPTPTPSPTPTATPNPDLDRVVYLPIVLRDFGAPPSPPTGWVWETTNTVAEILGGCCDTKVVVVEGQIGEKDQTHPDWNEYKFTDDSGGPIILDFEDEIPAAAIPQNTTVRIIGKVINSSYRKIDVYGLQTLGDVSAQPDRTVGEISNDCCDGQEVAVKGAIGAQDMDYPTWNVWDFSDNSDTTKADLENDLTSSQIPQNRTFLLYGQGGSLFGTPKINARLMLFAANIQ